MMHKIFIVEDDTVIASAIAEHLKNWGCSVRCAADFQNILAEFADYSPLPCAPGYFPAIF